MEILVALREAKIKPAEGNLSTGTTRQMMYTVTVSGNKCKEFLIFAVCLHRFRNIQVKPKGREDQ